jgi:pimeloyl-ACP methyl ester carboxylesterase
MRAAAREFVYTSVVRLTRAGLWRRPVFRIARGIVFVYLGVAIVLYAMQTSLIFPGHSTQGSKLAVVRPGLDHELLELKTTDGTKIAAVFGKALSPDGQILADSATRPTVLFFYGNGMCMADFMGEFRKFRKLGVNMMVPDYAGYGMSGGKPSEQSFYATADACWNHLMSRDDIDKSRIVAAGWSIGAAVSIDLAARKPAWRLATFSAFTSMTGMGRHLLPWLPTSLLLKHRFDNTAKLPGIKVPTLIIHGRHDAIIPFFMSEKLAAIAGGPVTTLWVQTDHNDLFDLGSEEILGVFEAFLHPAAPPSRSP